MKGSVRPRLGADTTGAMRCRTPPPCAHNAYFHFTTTAIMIPLNTLLLTTLTSAAPASIQVGRLRGVHCLVYCTRRSEGLSHSSCGSTTGRC
ncbi:hypothetical protein E2C01_067951 [Portunus trituberculatus]|uniref:Uncharacterized protein n=1 Tax=Portunus trituberculatus TaxID=210409 RepID=A0A5B7HV92_PORTR|nr:hypothetical protein [Portunus trituberculatus]